MVAVLTLVWGTNWPLFPSAVREVSVLTFRAVSMVGAGAALLAFAAWCGHPLSLPKRSWVPVVAASVVYLVVWNIASAYAAILIPSGQAAVLGFTMPLWAALAAWALLGETLGRRMLVALALGGLGVGMLMLRGAATYAHAPLGFGLGLLAGLGWALGTLILKRWPVAAPATVLAGWQLLIAAAPIALGAFWFGDRHWFVPSWPSIVVIAYIALVPTAIGNAAWFMIVGLLPANVAGLAVVMVPVVAMVSGALLRGEPLGTVQLTAMLCSAAGLGLALLKPGNRRSRLHSNE